MTNQSSEDQAFQALDDLNNGKDTDYKEIALKAQREAREAQEKLNSFAKAITGEKDDPWGFSAKDVSGNPAPRTWEEGASKIAQKAVEEAKRAALEEIESKTKAERDAEEARNKEQEKARQEVYKTWDDDWQALIEEGLLPDMTDETKQKLKENKLSREEALQDPGLKKRYELLTAAETEMAKGKNVNLYRFFKTKYSKKPGMDAPVSGGSTPAPTTDDKEYSYEEIRKKSSQLVW